MQYVAIRQNKNDIPVLHKKKRKRGRRDSNLFPPSPFRLQGITKGRYVAAWPVFIVSDNRKAPTFTVRPLQGKSDIQTTWTIKLSCASLPSRHRGSTGIFVRAPQNCLVTARAGPSAFRDHGAG